MDYVLLFQDLEDLYAKLKARDWQAAYDAWCKFWCDATGGSCCAPDDHGTKTATASLDADAVTAELGKHVPDSGVRAGFHAGTFPWGSLVPILLQVLQVILQNLPKQAAKTAHKKT